MEFDGSRIIAADRKTVWARLNDAETLKACIRGCEEMIGTPEDGFEAVLRYRIGPIRATFKGYIAVENPVPPESYRLIGEGKGGIAGFAKGAAEMRLAEVPEGTEVTYTLEVQVGGRLAQLGGRAIGGAARRMIETFFDRFEEQVESRSEA